MSAKLQESFDAGQKELNKGRRFADAGGKSRHRAYSHSKGDSDSVLKKPLPPLSTVPSLKPMSASQVEAPNFLMLETRQVDFDELPDLLLSSASVDQAPPKPAEMPRSLNLSLPLSAPVSAPGIFNLLQQPQ